MDNAQKAIMIGVGLFIAIIIISAVLLITNMGSNMIKKSTTDLGTLTDDLANQIVKDYDAKVISGTEALTLVNKYYISNDVSIWFTNTTTSPVTAAIDTAAVKAGAKILSVATGSTIGQTGQTGTAVAGAKTLTLATVTDTTSTNYIAPGTYYKTSVIKNATSGAVLGIAIQKAS